MMDVAVIGGSFSGLTAALQLARASRSVTVFDTARPRNRMSAAAHGVPGWDGVAPTEILDKFRADLESYSTVSLKNAQVVDARRSGDTFSLTDAGGGKFEAKRIILAHGVRDILPDIPGVAEAWGATVLHCPYCHGYEVRGQKLAVLATHPMSAHQAAMLRSDWSDKVTLLTAGMEGFDEDALRTTGIEVDPRRVVGVHGNGFGIELELADGQHARFAALFAAPRVSLENTPATQLYCALSEGAMGPFVQIGPMAQTSIPGVFAAGDVARPNHNVTLSLGDGANAGFSCHQSLLFPELVQPLQLENAA